ncbi:MAG: ABC transporter ATP-binding protein, partial [Clostridia bacterium]|nr:ABC transporter ATP-binding protein [Clostridia bacterium]
MAINRYDKDEELNIRVDFSYFSMLKKYVAPHAGKMALVVLIMFANAFLELLPPYFISIVLDKCLPQKDYALLYKLGAVLVASFVMVWVCQRVRPAIAHTTSMNIIKEVRSDLFRHMQHLPLRFFDTRPHGKILVRVVNYVNTIANLLSNGIFDMITNIFKMFVILGFMFAMDVKFTFICIAGLPIFASVLLFIKSRHRRAWQKYSAKQSNLNAYIQESISGMKITQSFARENENAEIFDGLCGESKHYWMRSTAIGASTARFINILSTTILTLIYATGVTRVAGGTLMVGTLIAFASYVSRFWEPIIVLSNFYNEIVNCGAYIERIFQMMDEPLIIEDRPDATDIGNV